MEILAPAGNIECGLAAIHSGANAVYLGASAFSARANAGNFDETTLQEFIKKAHFLGVKVYVAMNTLVKDSEMDEFIEQLLSVWNMGVDAVILQDLFLGEFIHETYPQIVLHLSTQAGVCTENGARFARNCGFSRVILARETAFSEIEKITKIIETEVFIQGALCSSFSGQCYFSSFAGGNSGNRGRCKQPCRKQYSIDRKGYEDKAYALSLSDLCIGEEIEKYLNAGVVSFKIEGRMRRAEYVSAAVSYYRSLIDGANEKRLSDALSDLKRTYNRGNYTLGLASGQDKRFLSRNVQGHLGEKIGVVKVINGKYFVETDKSGNAHDGYKILRKGKEVAGATFLKTERRGIIISSNSRLLNGDDVFITTDTKLNERLLQARKTLSISLSLYFKEGESAIAESGDVILVDENRLATAQSRPLTVDEVKNCFLKTDELPVEIEFLNVVVEGNIFIPKSQLNAFRRAFYEKLYQARLQIQDRHILLVSREIQPLSGTNDKTAMIGTTFTGEEKVDIAIIKPDDYTKGLPKGFLVGGFEKYLYYPAFLTTGEEEILAKIVQDNALDGVYAENYAGVEFARRNHIKAFAGTGFNLTNTIAINELCKNPEITYYALSKELDEKEQNLLSSSKAFVLSAGDLKTMDLCYCPFQKTCKDCDKRTIYSLTDENGREFPLRRYVSPSGNCRFEVYNCANLLIKPPKQTGELFDISVCKEKGLHKNTTEEERKKLFTKITSGHSKTSVI